MITDKQRKFLDNLTDKEYREMFADELVGTSLAFQIRRLRDARRLSQADISRLTGKAQPTISQWEDPNYGRYTLSTLKGLAAAFGVALLVKFVSFSELADWTVDVDPNRLTPPSFDEEQQQMSFAVVTGDNTWPLISRPISYDTLPDNAPLIGDYNVADMPAWDLLGTDALSVINSGKQSGRKEAMPDSSSAVHAKVSAYVTA